MRTRIKGFEHIIQAVGFETEFHDSEVLSIGLTRIAQKPSLEITILTRQSLRE